jgi:ferrous iron transport protein A
MSGFTNQQALSPLWCRLKVHGPIKNNYHYGDTLIIDFGDMALPRSLFPSNQHPNMSTTFFLSPSLLDNVDETVRNTAGQPLSVLGKGHTGIVVGMAPAADDEQLAVQMRLRELGFVPGEELRVVAESFPGRDPIAVRLGSTTFALRRFEAAMVHVIPT